MSGGVEAIWENGRIVVLAAVQAGPIEKCAAKISAHQIRSAPEVVVRDTRAPKIRIAKAGLNQVGSAQSSIPQNGIPEIRSKCKSPIQIGTGKVGFSEVTVGEIDSLKLLTRKISPS